MNMCVRPARAGDGRELYRVWQQLRKHYAATDSRIMPTPVSEEEFVAGLRETLAREASAAFVAEDDGRLVGFISGGIERNQPDRLPEQHATIGYIYVEPSHRRLGVGRQLFDAVAQWAVTKDGISHFEMTVLAADRQAADFWRTIGFTPFIERLWAPLDGPEDDA
jgi:GNAT superfamily N-acetyltransferase